VPSRAAAAGERHYVKVAPANEAEMNQLERTNSIVTVGIIGDFDPASETHRATSKALHHAAHAVGIAARVSWLPTSELSTGRVHQLLSPFDALWAAPGSPYASMGGALCGIRFAREQGRPFVGT